MSASSRSCIFTWTIFSLTAWGDLFLIETNETAHSCSSADGGGRVRQPGSACLSQNCDACCGKHDSEIAWRGSVNVYRKNRTRVQHDSGVRCVRKRSGQARYACEPLRCVVDGDFAAPATSWNLQSCVARRFHRFTRDQGEFHVSDCSLGILRTIVASFGD